MSALDSTTAPLPLERAARKDAWLPALLRAFVHAIGASVLIFPLAKAEGIAAAAFGAAIGSALGKLLARGRLRTAPLLGVFFLVFASGIFARYFATESTSIPALLGSADALRLGDAAFFFAGALALVASLRALSARRPALAVLEVLFVGLSFIELVAAHRGGAINRPFEIADPILAAGGDPTLVFAVVGLTATGLLVLLLMYEQGLLRSALHLGVAALLLLALFTIVREVGVPSLPTPPDALGLREGEDGQQGKGSPQSEEAGQPPPSRPEELELKDQYEGSTRTPVGIVLLHDDYSPPAGTYYFRQGAFSRYNGKRLVSAQLDGIDTDLAESFPTRPTSIPGAPALEPHRRELETTVALLADHRVPLGLEAPLRFEPLSNPRPDMFRRAYRVASGVLQADLFEMLGAKAGDPTWTPAQRALYLELPANPQYETLATHILDEKLPEGLRERPAARAFAITDWLGQEGTYSLKSRHASAPDPVADFLFGDKTGYCVHFANAAVYLMRSVGLPARVATGYAIQEAARQGGSAMLLSSGDEHAWPEVYLEGLGWVVMDVAPAQVVSAAPPPPDPDLQRLLGELARGMKPMPISPDEPLPRFVLDMKAILLKIAYALPWLLGALLLLLFAIKAWRRIIPRVASRSDRARLAYRAALDRLAEVSLRREPGESRERFARRLRQHAPSFGALTTVHLAAAFGSPSVDRKIEQLPALLRSIRYEVGEAIPFWRRALGWLTPWSWLLSR